MSIKTILQRILALLKRHKKKSSAVLIIIIAIAAFRYMKSQRQLDMILNKMQEKITKQIEENLKETETVRKMMLNMDDLFSHFVSLRPAIKRNLKKEVEYTFNFVKIKEDLKQKSLSADQKKLLWSSLKLEIFTHVAYTLTVVPTANLIAYLRDCVVQKYEKDLKEDDESIEMLNDFLNDFTDFVIKNGSSNTYSHFKKELAGDLDKIAVTAQFDMEKMDNLLGEILEIATKRSSVQRHSKPKIVGVNNGETGISDVNGISKILIGTINKHRENPSFLSKRFYSLKVPDVRMEVMSRFMEPIQEHSLISDENFVSKYVHNSPKHSEVVPSLTNGNGNGTEVESATTTDLSLLAVSRNSEQQHRTIDLNKMDRTTRVKLVSGILKKATNELLDLLESKSFDLILSFTIRYEFIKLKNRLLLFFEKSKTTDKMNLANYMTKINQIVNDEFIDENCDQNNEDFYNRRLKLALLQSSDKEGVATATEQELLLTYNLLKEYEAATLLTDSIKDFGKRVYMEEYYGKYFENQTTNEQSKDLESADMEQFLKSLSAFTGQADLN